jgi:hypothetical protein
MCLTTAKQGQSQPSSKRTAQNKNIIKTTNDVREE